MHIRHGGVRVFAMARWSRGGYYNSTEYGVASDKEL
jgi:hypothetical protein